MRSCVLQNKGKGTQVTVRGGLSLGETELLLDLSSCLVERVMLGIAENDTQAFGFSV